MDGAWIYLVFGAGAAGLYFLWILAEKLRERRAARLLKSAHELGEAVPASLHPYIDPHVCIGSGTCVAACPEKDVIGMVGGQAKLIGPLACIGHGACAASCPVQAIKLVFGTQSRGVELPKVDKHFQTSSPGVYVVGELGGMGLIRNAVTQGRQAAEHVASSSRRGTNATLDAIVVGAGPAGISATLELMRNGLRVKLLEREAFGGTIAHYPRAKVVMTGTLEVPMYGSVKRRKMSKEQLLGLWNDIREKTNLPVETGHLVDKLQRGPGNAWVVHSSQGTSTAANVLLALGRRGSPRKLGVPGEQLPKVHYRLLEPREFKNKHVLVVGGGNSAVESALSLAQEGKCASVTISYRRDAFGRCRAENRTLIDKAIRAGTVQALMPSNVSQIAENKVTLKDSDGQEHVLENDAVIIQAGGTAPAALLSSFGIELITKYGEA